MSVIANAFVRFNAQDSGLFRKMMRIERGFNTMRTSYFQFAAATASVALFGKVIRDAIDFEAELFNVRKTTNLTVEQVKNLGENFKDMSIQTGIARKELAEIAVVAGRLGIVTRAGGVDGGGLEALEEFTKLIAQTRVAMPELAQNSEEAATKVAKLLNIMNLDIGAAENFLSTINTLSNTTAAGADDIAEFTRRIGATAISLGSTAPRIAALSATLTEVGSSAELGGTAVSRMLIEIQKNTDKFAKALGPAGDEFRQKFIEDPILGFQVLIEELSKMDAQTRTTFMDNLNISGVRVIQTLNQLSGPKGVESLRGALQRAELEFRVGTSVQDEFNRRLEATQSSIQRMAAAFGAFFDTFAQQFFPVITRAADTLREAFDSEDMRRNIQVLGRSLAFIINQFVSLISVLLRFREILIGVFSALLVSRILSAVNALVSFNKALTTTVALGKIEKSNIAIRGLANAYLILTQALNAAKTAFVGMSIVQARNTLGQFSGPPMGLFDPRAAQSIPKQIRNMTLFRSVIAAATAGVRSLAIALRAIVVSNPVIAALTGIALAAGLLVRQFRKAREEAEKFAKFGDNNRDLLRFGDTGSDVIDAVERIRSARDGLSRQVAPGVRVGLSGADFVLQMQEVERATERGIDALRRLGLQAGLSFSEVEEITKNAGKNIDEYQKALDAVRERGDESLRGNIENWLKVEQQVKESAKSSSLSAEEMQKRVEESFIQMTLASGKFNGSIEEMVRGVRQELIIQAAEMQDIGQLWTLALAEGMTLDEAIRKARESGVAVSDQAIQNFVARTADFGDAGKLASLLYSLGLLNSEALAKVNGENLGREAVLALASKSIEDEWRNLGERHGITYSSEFIKNGPGAIMGISTALNLSEDTRDLQRRTNLLDEALKEWEAFRNRLQIDPEKSGTKKESEAQKKLKKDIEDTKKKIEDYQKEYISSLEKRLERKKEEVGLTQQELRVLERLKVAQGDVFGQFNLDEKAKKLKVVTDRISDMQRELESARNEVRKIEQAFDDMRERSIQSIQSLDDQLQKLSKDSAENIAKAYLDAVKVLEEPMPDSGFSVDQQKARDDARKTVEIFNTEFANISTLSNIPDRSEEKRLLQAQLVDLNNQIDAYKAIGSLSEAQTNRLNATKKRYEDISNVLRVIADQEKMSSALASSQPSLALQAVREMERLEALSPIERAMEEERIQRESLEAQKNAEIAFQNDLSRERDLQLQLNRAQREKNEKEILRLREEISQVFIDGELARFREENKEKLSIEVQRAIDKQIAEANENLKRLTSARNTEDRITTNLLVNIDIREKRSADFERAEIQRMNNIRASVQELTDAYLQMAAAASGSASTSIGSLPGNKKGGFIRGYAGGGFTGNVGVTKPAGVVHGGEWVAPAWMVNKFPGLMSWLESLRNNSSLPGFQSGGLVDILRNSMPTMPSGGNEVKVEVTNHISSPLDMDAFSEQLGYAISKRFLR